MARPSDREYALKRKVKDLETQNDKLEAEVKKLKAQIEKANTPKEEYKKKPGKPVSNACPDCGAEIKSTELPHGYMDLCTAACGYRKVRNK